MKTLTGTMDYLSKKYNIAIIIKDFTYTFLRTPPLNTLKNKYYHHANPYCLHIKSNPDAAEHCVKSSNDKLQKKILANANTSESFWGVCYGGVKEYVIPLLYDNMVIGALIVGAFPCEKERQDSTFERISEKYGFNPAFLQETYKDTFIPNTLDTEIFAYEIKLCALYLEELIKKYVEPSALAAFADSCTLQSNRFKMMDAATGYILSHLDRKITIQDIADYCYCSKSTISHLFKRILGTGVTEYITNERILYAQRLLRETTVSISSISEMCGFCSPIYFANTFKKYTGITASQYRKKYLKKSYN